MIGVIGINHKKASQDIRELFSFTKEEILPFAEIIQQRTEITEIVVLSTCNRTEIYYYHNRSCDQKSGTEIIGFLHDYKSVEGSFESYFYRFCGIEAVKHLFEVTSGTDSIVIGEDQIVNQVKDAYMYCTEAALTDAVLMRLFQKCFETSKRVRSETALQQGPTSVSYVAVDLCARIYNDLTDKSVLFVGSGKTGSLALYNMKKRGVTKTFISNRTPEKAVELAKEYGGVAVDFENLKQYIPQSDIVIVATGAQNHLIDRNDVQTSLAERDNKPQVYIDLSVPRNIDKTIAEIEKVKLYSVDDLQEVIDTSADKRVQSIEQANVIINEMAGEYMQWFESLTLRPIIKNITSGIQKIRDAEMNAYQATEDEQKFKLIDEYTNRISQKYIGVLIKRLKEISRDNPTSHSLNIINELFRFE